LQNSLPLLCNASLAWTWHRSHHVLPPLDATHACRM
jgi:hypothetical protein